MQTIEVKEIQGLYGPFTLTERIVQKIWLRQDFETAALKTTCGKSIQVNYPGRWNLLGGPDFKEARLRIDDQTVEGDVEVHFSPSDWYAHRHEINPEFNRVILHVVLHDDREGALPVKTLAGDQPVLLILMPLLDRDLEAYVTDEALLEMEQVNDLEWVASFLEKTLEQRISEIRVQTERRWRQKCAFAKKRLASTSWEEACHQSCLEVLGYSRNRAPLSRIALEYPLSAMATTDMDAERLFAERSGDWKLSGLRPANHPLKRLEQYLKIVSHCPAWPSRLCHALQQAPVLSPTLTTRTARRLMAFPMRAGDLRVDIFDAEIGATRFHTMMVDAFLPLATAAGMMDGRLYWSHWWAGDCPDAVRQFLKYVELTGTSQPLSNGLVQGALSLFMNRGD